MVSQSLFTDSYTFKDFIAFQMIDEIIYPYPQCPGCEFISDCPHPGVTESGRPVEPEECLKVGNIIYCQRPKKETE